MSRIVTKIKKHVKGSPRIPVENSPGWQMVLEDLRAEIARLQKLVPIVERKITRGEAWPGTQSHDQESGQHHSV